MTNRSIESPNWKTIPIPESPNTVLNFENGQLKLPARITLENVQGSNLEINGRPLNSLKRDPGFEFVYLNGNPDKLKIINHDLEIGIFTRIDENHHKIFDIKEVKTKTEGLVLRFSKIELPYPPELKRRILIKEDEFLEFKGINENGEEKDIKTNQVEKVSNNWWKLRRPQANNKTCHHFKNGQLSFDKGVEIDIIPSETDNVSIDGNIINFEELAEKIKMVFDSFTLSLNKGQQTVSLKSTKKNEEVNIDGNLSFRWKQQPDENCLIQIKKGSGTAVGIEQDGQQYWCTL